MLHKLLNFKFSQYTSQNHSLLSQIYSYTYNQHYVGYILMEHKTKSLISIDPGVQEAAYYNIKMLEQQHQGYRLKYIFQTHGQSVHTQSTRKLYNEFSDTEVYCGEIEEMGTLFKNKIARDLSPFTIGDLSICFIKESGHQSDNYMIAITHVTPDSSKIPILFSGDSILINSVGRIDNYQEFYMSQQKLRGFHDETLIFPGHQAQKENLLFARTLEPENVVVNSKLNMDNLIPTTLIEERMGNPYFRFQQLKIESDPIRFLRKLKNIQQKYFNG